MWASWKPNHWKGFDLVLLWGNGCLKVGCGSIALCKSDLIRIGTQLLDLEVSTQPLGKVAK